MYMFYENMGWFVFCDKWGLSTTGPGLFFFDFFEEALVSKKFWGTIETWSGWYKIRSPVSRISPMQSDLFIQK